MSKIKVSPIKNEAGLYEIDIDDKKYEFQKWGAEEALDALLEIAAITGKPLGMGAAAMFGKDENGGAGLDKQIDTNIIGTIMEALSTQIGANKLIIKALVKKLSSEKVLCDGGPVNFNTHYQDKLAHLFKVVQAGLEVQFGNFFGALLGATGVKLPKGITNRESPISNGQSGGL